MCAHSIYLFAHHFFEWELGQGSSTWKDWRQSSMVRNMVSAFRKSPGPRFTAINGAETWNLHHNSAQMHGMIWLQAVWLGHFGSFLIFLLRNHLFSSGSFCGLSGPAGSAVVFAVVGRSSVLRKPGKFLCVKLQATMALASNLQFMRSKPKLLYIISV